MIIRYLVEPRYQMFYKATDFCLMLKKWVRRLAEI